PSVPTSRATRVTSEAKEPSCSTIVLTVLAVRRNSPFSGRPSCSTAIFCDRSPLATAPMTRAVSLVGWTRLVIRVLTFPTDFFPQPGTPPPVAPLHPPPSPPDTLVDPLRFLRQPLAEFEDVVERVGDLPVQAGEIGRQPHVEIPLSKGQQRLEQRDLVQL